MNYQCERNVYGKHGTSGKGKKLISEQLKSLGPLAKMDMVCE